eukprot:TRINITY_DN5956_c0_g1_i1.p1 TRINITY_DN5956_c0_g1~~TRINITY_DN5956_c0_g1_i1.p1  ORF type:complete len:347 (-),score=48.57 TRINITY_DN5956_c0_g1_i1:46-1086(-)
MSSSSSSSFQLLRMMTGYWVSRAIYTVSKLGVADFVHKAGEVGVHCDKLGELAKANSSAIYRLLRALSSVGIFKEVSPNTFAHTDLSSHLISTSPLSLHNASLMYGEECWKVWERLPEVVLEEKPFWPEVYDGKTLFEYCKENPSQFQVFSTSMTEMGKLIYKDENIIQSYEFEKGKTIVDIGGGFGSLLAQMLNKNTACKGVLYELPSVIEDAKKILSENLELKACLDRLEFQTGNFFKEVPKSGDYYVLKRVLHDWNEDMCVEIMKNVSESMPKNGKVLIIETVIPTGNDFHYGKWLDLHMMVILGGKERSVEEFRKIFHAAGLKLTRVIDTGTPISIVEGEKM